MDERLLTTVDQVQGPRRLQVSQAPVPGVDDGRGFSNWTYIVGTVV